jgi:AcrR family transcriptional regulator
VPVQSPRRTQQERRQEAERRLLQAAARLIAEKGSVATTLAQVGEAAGYSRGIVQHHFGSKAALLERLATATQTAFSAAVAPATEGLRGLDALVTVVEAYLGGLASSRHGGKVILVMWAEAAIGIPEMRTAMADSDRRFRRWIAGAVRDGQADGTIGPDIEPGAVAAAVVAELRGIGLQLLIDGRSLDMKSIRTQVPAMLRKALAA